jgi:hypothetical protein
VSRSAANDEDDRPWDARILAVIDAGVDETIIAERLKLTPTERIETMRAVLQFAEDARQAMRGNRLP